MRLTRVTVLLALCLMLVSCGGSFDTINGTWTATLSGTINGTAVIMKFTVTLNQTSPPDVDATNFIQSAPNSCFNGSSTLTSTFSGGAFTLHVADSQQGPFQNKLDLQGNVDGSNITGNWTLTPGVSQESCQSSGTFKMTKN